MSKVYKILNDRYNFQEFDLEREDLLDALGDQLDEPEIFKFSWHNTSFKDHWPRLSAGFRQIEGMPAAPIPDVSRWIDASLVLSPKAHEALKTALGSYGELLPVTCAGDTYYVFNCRTLVDTDENASEKDIQDGAFMGIKRLSFDSQSLNGNTIFKTKYDYCTDLYCQSELKELIENAGLSGIKFQEDLASIF